MNAQDQARKISENLKETRTKKITQRERKRKREPSQEEQPKRSFVEALRGLMSEYSANKKHNPKNGDAPQEGGRSSTNKGKGPANGRGYVKKTWPPQTRKP